MKRFLIYAFVLLVGFEACNKSNHSTPSSPAPIGISATVNGQYTTFNRNISIDTSSTANEISITASGDSTPFRSSILGIVVRGPGTGLVKPGLYTYAGYDYSGGLGIATTINYSQVLFGSYDDSITVATVTDSTVSGTFHGNIEGQIINFNDPQHPQDSVITVVNGKFNLKW